MVVMCVRLASAARRPSGRFRTCAAPRPGRTRWAGGRSSSARRSGGRRSWAPQYGARGNEGRGLAAPLCAFCTLEGAVQHVLPVAGERQLQERAGEAGARLDEGVQAPARDVEALEGALVEVPDLVDEPVAGVGIQGLLVAQ